MMFDMSFDMSQLQRDVLNLHRLLLLQDAGNKTIPSAGLLTQDSGLKLRSVLHIHPCSSIHLNQLRATRFPLLIRTCHSFKKHMYNY